jgi:hypothetical protein
LAGTDKGAVTSGGCAVRLIAVRSTDVPEVSRPWIRDGVRLVGFGAVSNAATLTFVRGDADVGPRPSVRRANSCARSRRLTSFADLNKKGADIRMEIPTDPMPGVPAPHPPRVRMEIPNDPMPGVPDPHPDRDRGK